jgi:FlaA1/EpsC-like NDP-sugar epimerase
VFDLVGGETYVKKIPSMKVTDIAKAVSEDAAHEIVGIRPGEKLHEQMIGLEDAPYTYEYPGYYKILPSINEWHKDPERIGDGRKVESDFSYCSDSNKEWMDIKTLQNWIEKNSINIGKI